MLRQVGVDEQKQECRVEEDHNECDLGRLVELLSLRWVADPSHKLDAGGSEHEVHACDEVLERVEPHEHLKCDVLVLRTNLNTLGVTISRAHHLIIVLFTFKLAQALQSTA